MNLLSFLPDIKIISCKIKSLLMGRSQGFVIILCPVHVLTGLIFISSECLDNFYGCMK